MFCLVFVALQTVLIGYVFPSVLCHAKVKPLKTYALIKTIDPHVKLYNIEKYTAAIIANVARLHTTSKADKILDPSLTSNHHLKHQSKCLTWGRQWSNELPCKKLAEIRLKLKKKETSDVLWRHDNNALPSMYLPKQVEGI